MNREEISLIRNFELRWGDIDWWDDSVMKEFNEELERIRSKRGKYESDL